MLRLTIGLLTIIKKRLNLELSFYSILQILIMTCFENVPVLQYIRDSDHETENDDSPYQLILINRGGLTHYPL
jgi:hypothetical protein